jgi:hypothetical protein
MANFARHATLRFKADGLGLSALVKTLSPDPGDHEGEPSNFTETQGVFTLAPLGKTTVISELGLANRVRE